MLLSYKKKIRCYWTVDILNILGKPKKDYAKYKQISKDIYSMITFMQNSWNHRGRSWLVITKGQEVGKRGEMGMTPEG